MFCYHMVQLKDCHSTDHTHIYKFTNTINLLTRKGINLRPKINMKAYKRVKIQDPKGKHTEIKTKLGGMLINENEPNVMVDQEKKKQSEILSKAI